MQFSSVNFRAVMQIAVLLIQRVRQACTMQYSSLTLGLCMTNLVTSRLQCRHPWMDKYLHFHLLSSSSSFSFPIRVLLSLFPSIFFNIITFSYFSDHPHQFVPLSCSLLNCPPCVIPLFSPQLAITSCIIPSPSILHTVDCRLYSLHCTL